MMLDIRTRFVSLVLCASLFAIPQALASDTAAGDSTGQAADGPPNGGAPFSGDQLTQQYSSLSPEVHAAVTDLLKRKGADALSGMSESDAQATFESLPANVKTQLQAKWDAMSDAQRAALKRMGPEAVKQMLAAQMAQMVQRTVAPVMKPIEDAIAGTRGIIDRTGNFLHRSREAVQRWIGSFRDDHDSKAAESRE